MSGNDVIQCVIYLAALILLVKPLGVYMAKIYEGKPAGLNMWFGFIERGIYRLSDVNPDKSMGWKTYAAAVMLFNILGIIVVYLLQRLQAALPLNPMAIGAVTPDLAFSTAVSFATNTNWQSYGGETTLSLLTQTVGLTVQNFVSAATGMAVLAGFIRGFIQKQTDTIGNFWVDLVRTTLYIY